MKPAYLIFTNLIMLPDLHELNFKMRIMVLYNKIELEILIL